LVGTRGKTCPPTRAQVTLSFDWLAFAVKLAHQTSFTANANQSNKSVTCAREASTEVCTLSQGKNLIFTTLDIDFHRSGN